MFKKCRLNKFGPSKSDKIVTKKIECSNRKKSSQALVKVFEIKKSQFRVCRFNLIFKSSSRHGVERERKKMVCLITKNSYNQLGIRHIISLIPLYIMCWWRLQGETLAPIKEYLKIYILFSVILNRSPLLRPPQNV